MFGREKRDAADSRMDDLGTALVRAARATDDEVEDVISSPLLYSRIQAAIAARARASGEDSGGWLGLLAAAKLAVPAMALLAIVVGSVPWFESGISKMAAVVSETDPTFASFAAGACALSNSDECAVSSSEVLATIFAEDDQEQQR